MRSLTKLVAVLLLSASAWAGTPTLRTVPVENVFVPSGFDSNDNSEVIVTGTLPNLCHRYPQTKVVVNGNKIDIRVEALYYSPSSPFCPQLLVPFMETVNLGVLDKGMYKITVNGQSPRRGHRFSSAIKVVEAPSDAVDDFIYANVEYVDKTPHSRTVVLKGHNPSDCFEFQEIKTVSNNKDTIAVLPILKKVHEYCPLKMVSFEYEMEVPRGLPAEKVLLHVRAMNGKSVNSLFLNKMTP